MYLCFIRDLVYEYKLCIRPKHNLQSVKKILRKFSPLVVSVTLNVSSLTTNPRFYPLQIAIVPKMTTSAVNTRLLPVLRVSDFGYYNLVHSDTECVTSTLGESEIEQNIIDQCSDPANGMTYYQSKG
jgi:hypothetical protein